MEENHIQICCFFSSRIVRFLAELQISSNFYMTRFSCLTNSLGLGNSLNLTVLINAFWNLRARWWAASISIIESPRAIMFVIIALSIFSWVSKKAWSFHLFTSPGKWLSYLPLAEIIVIFSKIGTKEGMNFCALNWTQPSAAFVIIKVFPYLIDS